jgi:hypothetical protein
MANGKTIRVAQRRQLQRRVGRILFAFDFAVFAFQLIAC